MGSLKPVCPWGLLPLAGGGSGGVEAAKGGQPKSLGGRRRQSGHWGRTLGPVDGQLVEHSAEGWELWIWESLGGFIDFFGLEGQPILLGHVLANLLDQIEGHLPKRKPIKSPPPFPPPHHFPVVEHRTAFKVLAREEVHPAVGGRPLGEAVYGTALHQQQNVRPVVHLRQSARPLVGQVADQIAEGVAAVLGEGEMDFICYNIFEF